jgi:predicted ATPase/DNA-binding SARP family transcriptional activator
LNLSNTLVVKFLGKFEVSRDGKAIAIISRPAQSLFAYLILNSGTSHRREKLAGLLWPESLEETARDNLRHALWRMRKALEAASSTRFLHADDLTIKFEVSPDCWLDAAALEKLSENASADELIAVLSEYQGELLPGFYDEWAVLEREHLYSIFEHHMARLLSLLQNEKRWLDILNWAERWIKFGQKPEPAYRALMSAHAAKGDMSKVAATYERCVKSLKEYGVEPSEQTRALYERLKVGKENLETGQIVLVKAKREESPKTNLPVPLTSFIGREREIEEVKLLLSSTRLLTLTGSGGVGKTRLAIQAANDLIKSYKDGVWWVELAPLIDEALVPQAVAQALGVRESPGQPLTESLKDFLREKQLLLALDNCEHLITVCAQLANDLLIQCADLRILTTSRETLGITGETTLHVPALSFPVLANLSQMQNLKEFESVQLFVERAAAAHPDLALTQQNAFAVTKICQRLDGIPLALELAAARVRVLSLEEIATHLDDRFTLLTHGSRTALPRQQTLRAAIDWSYDLLSGPEQIFFKRLSVFAGGFTLEAAEVVAAGEDVSRSQATNLVGQLINKSLVTVEARSENADTRYGMLETIREYAREKLDGTGETERVRQRHRDMFIAFAEGAEPKLKGAEQLEWLDRLEVEHDNLRAAWDCAIESDPEVALKLVSALLHFWFMRGNPSEGHEWSTRLLERTNQWGQTAKRAHVLGVAGWLLAYYPQHFAAARQLLGQALAIARTSGDTKEIAFVLLWLGATAAYGQHDDQTAQSYAEECLTIYQGLQDQWGIAMAMLVLGHLAVYQGHYAEAGERYLKSLITFRELGDKFRTAHVLNALGAFARFQDDYQRAGKFYEENVRMLRELHSRVALAAPTFNLAWASLHGGDYREAKALFEESLELWREDGHKQGMTDCLAGFGGVLAKIAKPAQAAQLFGAVEALYEGIGRLDPSDQEEFDHYVAAVRAQLAEAAFTKAWSKGREMTLEQAIAFALEESKQWRE